MKFIISSTFLIIIFSMSACSQGEIDNSHTLEEAIELGLPSIEKEWLLKDYKQFEKYLDEISLDAYPRLRSKRSKAIFEKIKSAVNQDILEDENVELETKMVFVLNCMQSFSAITKKYNNALDKGIDYSLEFVHLQGILFGFSNQTIPLAKQFFSTLDPNKESYEIRKDGLAQMKNGIATMLDGLLLSLTETNVYSDEERIILVNYLFDYCPMVFNFLDPSVKRKFEVKILKHVENESNKEIKGTLVRLLRI